MPGLLVLVPLALTVWVYYPITRVFFFADDFVHQAEIINERALVFLLKPFGGQAFLGRNLVYLGLYHLFGPDPVALQRIVLLTHLVNVVIAFAALRAFTGSAWLACLGATVFGASPLVTGTLGWYAAFGHVLVGTILWGVLLGVARAIASDRVPPTRTVAGWCALLLVGATCYGPGMGVACAFPVTAVVLLPAIIRRPRVLATLLALPVATLALYVGLRWAYTRIGQLPLEEILQQKLAMSGFQHIPPLFGHLLGYSLAGTLLGFFLKTYPGWSASLAVVAFAGGLAFVAWRGSAVSRRTVLAMVLLWLGAYLVIAAGRAHIYALFNMSPAVSAMMGRYHYAGLIPLVVGVCVTIQVIVRTLGPGRLPAVAVPGLLLAVWMFGYVHRHAQIDEHPLAHDWFLSTRQGIAAAVAAAPPGTVYLENGTTPRFVLGPALPDRLFPGRAGVFLLSHPSGRLDGRDVRFIERDPEVLGQYAAEPESLLGRLLVAPADVPARP
jgi:hypothetical protein